MDLERALYEKSQVMASSLPQIFNAEKQGDRQRLSRLIRGHAIRHVSDDYEEQMREYFGILNPGIVYAHGFEEKFQAYFTNLRKKKSLWQSGRWVYFPWLSALSHILEDKEFQMVRTARNRNLITANEQKKFYNSVIGIAGLSVGNSVALAIVLSGGGRHMRLAGPDSLALSNTNRIRAGVESLGVSKVVMTARQIYEANPYAEVEIFPDGLTRKNIGRFFAGPRKLDIVVDE